MVLKNRDQLLAILIACGVVGESCILAKLIGAQNPHQPAPLLLCAHPYDKITPLVSSKHLVRHNIRVSISPPLRRHTRIQIAAADVCQPRQLRIKQRHIQIITLPTAFACEKRSQDPHRGVHSCGHISDGDRKSQWVASRLTSKTHHPCFGLSENVVTWLFRFGTSEPISRDTAVNESWISRPQRFRIKPAALQRNHGWLIANKNVGGGE